MDEELHKWEIVAHDTHRMRVPGGWVYQVGDDGAAFGCFVPHPPMVQLLPDGTMAVVAPPIVVAPGGGA